MAHELWLIKGTTMTNITPLVGSIGRRSSKDELGEELTFDIAINDAVHFPTNPCDLGDIVVLKNKDKEITRAVIVDESKSGRSPVQYSAFDYAFYLNKSNATYQFKKMDADKCIKKIADDSGVPVGNIVSMPVPITKIYPDDVVSEIIRDIIATTETKLKQKYVMEMRGGKLYVEKRSEKKIKATFMMNGKIYDATTAISNPSKKRSIAEMKNSIQVVGNDDKLVLTKSDDAMVSKFGKLQKVVQLDQEEKKSAKEVAESELKEFSKIVEEMSVELMGDDEVRAGRLIELTEPITGIEGTLLISNVSHTMTASTHKMSLGLELNT